MAPATFKEHPVFANLLHFLNTIPLDVCSNAPLSFCVCGICKKKDLLDKLKGDVKCIHDSLQSLSKFEQNLEFRLGPLKSRVNDPGFLDEPRFKEVVSAVTQLKFKLPYTGFDEFGESDDPPVSSQEDPSPEDVDREFVAKYNNLNSIEKKCLWCFSVFPANAEIKKRVLINWWIGEGLIPQAMKSSGKEEGEGMLRNLEEGGFIVQVLKKKRRSNRWRMPETVRSLVVLNPTEDLGSNRLVLRQNLNLDLDGSNLKAVKTVFNLDKTVITEREAGLVADMKNLVVLHLGKSHVRGLNLITRSLKKKKHLSFLSLEGTLSLKELPSWVCNLKTLRVLDISQCQALEQLPAEIGSLRSLSHLDFSGCHILFEMPKAIKSLSALEVLKGFVIGPNTTSPGCILTDLGRLERLRELSLSVLRMNFPTTQDLDDLAAIKGLVSLKIQWKPASSNKGLKPLSDLPLAKLLAYCVPSDGKPVKGGENAHPTSLAHCLLKLEKLDLWFAPKDSAPFLLDPTNFPALKQLCITASGFDQLRLDNVAVWEKVEVLRLISVPQLSHIDWHDLHNLFPGLTYLELLNCPNLQFSEPFVDQDGVWTKQQ